MRLVSLYLRSRRVGFALAVLAVLAVGAWLWRHVAAGDPLSVALLVMAPSLAAASIIAGTTGSPFADLEATASYTLPLLRFVHLGGLFAFAALSFVIAGDALGGSLVRDLAGFAGLALLTARITGAAAAWSVPSTYGVLALLLGSDRLWAWPVQVETSQGAALVVVLLLVLGFGIVVWLGTPYRADAVA